MLCRQAVAPVLDLKTLLSFKPVVSSTICASCQRRFTRINSATQCPSCGRKQANAERCYDCQRWDKATGSEFKNWALYDYNAAMKSYFSEYKFRGDYRLRRVFNADLRQAIKRLKPDVVTVIPVTETTLQTRGFNQVAGLIEGVVFCNVLAFSQSEKQQRQSQKDRHQRLLTAQPFRIKEVERASLFEQRVLVVDDVYTTGRTIRHAADLLNRAGAKTVQGLTLAHG